MNYKIIKLIFKNTTYMKVRILAIGPKEYKKKIELSSCYQTNPVISFIYKYPVKHHTPINIYFTSIFVFV